MASLPLYHGNEFSSQLMDLWAYHNKVSIDFSGPGTPTNNAHIVQCDVATRVPECALVRVTAGRSRPDRGLGGGSITRVGLTEHFGTARPKNLPGPPRRMTAANPSSPLETPPSDGPELRDRPKMRQTHIAAGTTTGGGSGTRCLSQFFDLSHRSSQIHARRARPKQSIDHVVSCPHKIEERVG